MACGGQGGWLVGDTQPAPPVAGAVRRPTPAGPVHTVHMPPLSGQASTQTTVRACVSIAACQTLT